MGHVARPKAKEFVEKNNAWLLDTYFVQLDEYGNQLTKNTEKDEALGLLKAYSGKSKVSIRTMRNDGYDYKHNATFIMTQNKNPLMIEDGDRRLVFLNTPNVMANQDWVGDAGGIYEAYEQIMSQVKDFCYYLATEVQDISNDAYMNPPYSKFKHEIVADSMYAAQKIGYAMKHGMQDYLIKLAEEFDDSKAIKAFKTGKIHADDIEDLYDEMTDFKGDMRSLNKTLRGMGIQLVPTTVNGTKVYKYITNWASTTDCPFGDEDEDG